MSSIAETSNQVPIFTKMASLTSKKEMRLLMGGTSLAERINLFSYISKKNFNCEEKIYQKIRAVTIEEITGLFQRPGLLSSELLEEIKSICKNILPGDVSKALRLAIDLDDVELARKAIAAGADVNKILHFTTPLLRACKYASSEMVELLLKNGADVKFVGGTHDHKTPLSVARRRGNLSAECFALLTERDDGFTEEVFALKHLAHKFSNEALDRLRLSVDGKEFFPVGFRVEDVVEDYIKKAPSIYEQLKNEIVQGRLPKTFAKSNQLTLQTILTDTKKFHEFMDAIDTMLSTIEHCMDYTDIDLNLSKKGILAHLHSGKPLACFGVSDIGGKGGSKELNLHANGLVFTKAPDSEAYRVYLCDRGGGLIGRGIRVADVNEQKMFEIIKTFQDLTQWKTTSKSEVDLLKEIPCCKLVLQKMQEAGVCCYYSLQSIELALLISLLTPIFELGDSTDLVRDIKRYRTLIMRYNDLKQYLESHLPGMSRYPVNWDLMNNIYVKARNKPKLSRYANLILDYALRCADLQNEHHFPVFFKNQYGSEAVEIYFRIRNAQSEEEKFVAVSDLIKINPRLVLDMIDFISMKAEELYGLFLKLNPSMFMMCLKKLYTRMEALSICMNLKSNSVIPSRKHKMARPRLLADLVRCFPEGVAEFNSINLKPFEEGCPKKFACKLINEVDGVENFKITINTLNFGFQNSLVHAFEIGLRNATKLILHNEGDSDPLNIQRLAKCCPNLRTLNMTYCENIDFSNVPPFVSFPELTHLSIRVSSGRSNINLKSVRNFKTLFPNLTSLLISGCIKTDTRIIQALSIACPKLESLNLSSCETVKFAVGRSFKGGFPNLSSLKLTKCPNIDIFSIRAFRAFCPNLTSLEISGNHINSEALEELALVCPLLESLTILQCHIGAELLKILSTRFLNLQTLVLNHSVGFNEESARALEKNERIQVLELTELEHVDVKALKILATAFPNLRSLNLGNNKYSKTVRLQTLPVGFVYLNSLDFSGYLNVNLDTIAGFKRLCPNLTTLKYSSSALDLLNLRELANACPLLTTLDLTGCSYYPDVSQRNISMCFPNVTDLNLTFMSTLVDHQLKLLSFYPNLLNLKLTTRGLCVSFFEKLAKLCPKLMDLNLTGCQSLDASLLRSLGTHFPGLTHLNLSRTGVKSDVIQVLAKDFQNLEMLNLSSCQEICSSDLQVIATGLFGLRELVLETCLYVDQSAIDSLKSSRPQIVVSH